MWETLRQDIADELADVRRAGAAVAKFLVDTAIAAVIYGVPLVIVLVIFLAALRILGWF